MAAKKSAQSYGDKMTFVTDLPPDVPAKEVVAKAKLAGIDISVPYVYTVRGLSYPRPGEAMPPTTPLKAARAKPTRDRASAKRDFVRSLSRDMPVADVVKQAERAGIALSKADVYQIRNGVGDIEPATRPAPISTTFRKPIRGSVSEVKSAAAPTLLRTATKPDLTSQLQALESEFVRRTLEIGLVRSTEILERLQHILA